MRAAALPSAAQPAGVSKALEPSEKDWASESVEALVSDLEWAAWELGAASEVRGAPEEEAASESGLVLVLVLVSELESVLVSE